MKRTAIGFLIVAVLFVLPRVASAQAKKGDREILVFGSTQTLFIGGDQLGGSSTSTSGTLFGNLGQFITDKTEVGGGPTITITAGGGNTHFGVGINVFGRYFFDLMNPKLKPYVGGEYQISELNPEEGQSVSDSQFINGVFGVKDYLSDKTALDVKGSYGFRPNAAADFQILTFTIGFSYLF